MKDYIDAILSYMKEYNDFLVEKINDSVLDYLLIIVVLFALIWVCWFALIRPLCRLLLRQFNVKKLFRFWLSADGGRLHIFNSFVFVVVFPTLIVLFFVVVVAVGEFGVLLLQSDGNDTDLLRGRGLTFFGLLTALAGILSAPLAVIRINATERQTRINEREYTTRLLTQATEHLGANLAGESSDNPDIPRRIGGLLALERIAQDNLEEYHLRIMTMICAYIRENSPYPERAQASFVSDSIREDIQIAIDILARRTREQVEWEQRPEEDYRLNLNNTDLTKADFTHRNFKPDFSRAFFRKSRLEEADLVEANLSKADFFDSIMINARLTRANLHDADLEGATVAGVDFDGAKMEGTKPEKSVVLEYVEKDVRLPYREDSS